MKKILIMNIGTELGGIERSLIDFLSFLSKEENYQIDLALWKKRGPMFNEIPSNINILENIGVGSFLEIRNQKGVKKISSYINYFLFKCARMFGNEHKVVPKLKKEYDVAISFCHNGYSPYYIIDRVNAKKKYIWYHHGAYDKKGKEKKKDEKYYQKYDKVITVSNANREMLKKHFPNIDIDVISNLINEEKILKLASEEVDVFNSFHGLKITTVGRVCEEKGQVFSIEVAKELKAKGVEFRWIFVGDGDERVKCEELLEEYGLQKHCFFVGGKENPYPYIKQADLYVQTSHIEAQPTTIREALVLKKNIIASNIPAIKEVLSNGRGRTCDLDIQKFVKAIINRAQKFVYVEADEQITKGKQKILELLQ